MKPKLLYVIDSFDRRGAQLGLLALAKNGFFDAFDLRVVGLTRGADSIYDDLIDLLGVERVVFLRETKRAKIRNSPQTIGLLRGEFDRFKPDVAVLSLIHSNLIGRVTALAFPEVKIATFEHNVANQNFLEWAALRITSGRVDLVFGDTKQTLRSMKPYYRRDARIYDVPLTILEPTAFRESSMPQRYKILSCGHLTEQKNYIQLIRAIGMLTDQSYDVELIIAGQGKQHAQLEALISKLGLGNRVHLTGFISNQQTLQTLRHEAHIYVQPSLYEGFCLAAAEALAAGLPTVATDFAGTRDYGFHGKNMIIAHEYSAEALAKSLSFLIDRYHQLAAPLSQAGIETTRERFSRYAVQALWEPAQAALALPRILQPSSPQGSRYPQYLFPIPRR